MAIATGASAPEALRWNAEAARILRTTCRLDGGKLARALAWWKQVRAKGERFGIRDQEIAWAITGLSQVMRVTPPWEPYRLFCRRNAALWQEAMSAGRRLDERQAKRIGQTQLLAKLTELAAQHDRRSA